MAAGPSMSYFGEASGAGVTALSPANLPRCQCFAAPCGCAEPAFDTPPDISTVVFGPGTGMPIFRAETVQLDWWRLVALAVGIWIGVKAFK